MRLRGTPLQTASIVLLAFSIGALAWSIVSARRSDGATSRVATALHHVTVALGGFFLFVSFAAR